MFNCHVMASRPLLNPQSFLSPALISFYEFLKCHYRNGRCVLKGRTLQRASICHCVKRPLGAVRAHERTTAFYEPDALQAPRLHYSFAWYTQTGAADGTHSRANKSVPTVRRPRKCIPPLFLGQTAGARGGGGVEGGGIVLSDKSPFSLFFWTGRRL